MKRRIALTVLVAFLLALTVPVVGAADTLTPSHNAVDALVTFNLEAGYTLSVPPDVPIVQGGVPTEEEYWLAVTDIVLPFNHRMTVTVHSANDFRLVDDEQDKAFDADFKEKEGENVFRVQYYMTAVTLQNRQYSSNAYADATPLFQITRANGDLTCLLSFTMIGKVKYPGEYTDTLTFTVKTENLNT